MSKRHKKRLTKVLIASLLFVVSFFFDGYVSVAVLCASYLVVGYDVLWGAVRKIFSGQIFDEEFLMSLATVGALLLQEYPEAAMVMILYQTGELFQGIAVGKSRKSIKELMKIKPDFATVLRDGREERVSPEEVKTGEIILVLPGEKVPLDGIIEEGKTSFDSSSLTGESLPIEAVEGEKAISGMINLESPVKIRVSGVFEESTVAKILRLVETSSAHKSQSEKFITKFSRKYTPCVFIAALLTAVVPPILLGQPFMMWVRRALVFLVVSCPCALVISVPLTFFGGIGAASKKGILIKGSNYLEALSKVEKVAFDKTGTITEGGFSVVKILPHNISEEELMETAALAESFSNHPIAVSIVKAYGNNLEKNRVQNVTNLPGNGIRAQIDGKIVLAGNKTLMSSNGVRIIDEQEIETVVYIAINGIYAGFIALTDKIKPEAKNSVKQLKSLGVKRSIMLTGDNSAVAEKIAENVCVDETYSSLLPQDKVSLALKIKGEGKGKIAFVGDGINDAPVLSCVDVGIAMGALGSDAAIEAADVVIMNDSLSAVAESIRISKKTMRIVRQNIWLSLLIKFGVMILSVLGFDNMYAAIFADVGVMIIAVLNAMRMLSAEHNKKE
ncbi:MAG: cadmium-translocating P-type ATPase [Ruminococcaceae bacterium]|nr:cadmium-translocating P-type ATPase [Oscillospiraceae bacterium]